MTHLCQAILDVLLRRSIEDVDAFLAPPSWASMPSSSTIEGADDAVRAWLVLLNRRSAQ